MNTKVYDEKFLKEAISTNDIDSINNILSHQPELINVIETTSLFNDVIKKGNKEIFHLFLDKGADVNLMDNIEHRPLHIACEQGNIDFAQELIKHGADVNAIEQNGHSLIMVGCYLNNLEFVKLLAENGADLKAENDFGVSVLSIAKGNSREEIIEYLKSEVAKKEKEISSVEKAAVSELEYKMEFYSELKIAVITLDTEKVQELLKTGNAIELELNKELLMNLANAWVGYDVTNLGETVDQKTFESRCNRGYKIADELLKTGVNIDKEIESNNQSMVGEFLKDLKSGSINEYENKGEHYENVRNKLIERKGTSIENATPSELKALSEIFDKGLEEKYSRDNEICMT